MKNIWKLWQTKLFLSILLSLHPILSAKENEFKPAPSHQDLSAKEAWEHILIHNSGIRSSQTNIMRASKLSTASKLSFLPSVDITAVYTHLSSPIAISNTTLKNDISQSIGAANGMGSLLLPAINKIPDQTNIINQDIIIGALNIIYPLYTGGKRIYSINISKLTVLDSKEALRLKILSTFQEFVQIYYNIWLNQEILKTTKAIHQSAKSHYEYALKLYKTGQVAKLEVLGAEVALQRSENSLKEAQNNLDIAQMALDTILNTKGINPISEILIPPSKPLKSEDYYVEHTLDSYPALRSLDYQIKIANEYKKIKIADFFPTITLAGSYFMDNKFLLDNPSLPNKNPTQSLPNWYVGAIARLPLISPTGRIPQIQAAKLAKLELEHSKSQARQDMELLVRRTYKETLFTQTQYQSMDKNIELAQENLKLQEKAFLQGLATSLQVNDARNTLQSTLLEQKMLAYKYIVLLAKLMAIGDDIDEFYELQR